MRNHRLLFWTVLFLGSCVLVAPLLTIEIPPIVDYPNHLARLYVLAHGASDPWLSKMYKPRWEIIPNLGIDLLVPWSLSFLPLHIAGRIMLALTLLLPVYGTIAYHRALFQRLSFWPLGSLMVAYNLIFFLGFHNVLLSYGVALLSSAVFCKTLRRNPITNTVIGAACTIVAFFTHIVGCALLLFIIFVHKMFYVGEAWPDWRRLGRALLIQGSGFALIALAPFGLYLASPLATAPVDNSWVSGIDKLKFLLSPVLNYYPILDLVTAGILTIILFVVGIYARSNVSRTAATVAAALFIAYPYLPSETKTATFVDVRFVIFLGFLIFCVFDPGTCRERQYWQSAYRWYRCFWCEPDRWPGSGITNARIWRRCARQSSRSRREAGCWSWLRRGPGAAGLRLGETRLCNRALRPAGFFRLRASRPIGSSAR